MKTISRAGRPAGPKSRQIRRCRRVLVRLRKFIRAVIYPFRGKPREVSETYLQR